MIFLFFHWLSEHNFNFIKIFYIASGFGPFYVNFYSVNPFVLTRCLTDKITHQISP